MQEDLFRELIAVLEIARRAGTRPVVIGALAIQLQVSVDLGEAPPGSGDAALLARLRTTRDIDLALPDVLVLTRALRAAGFHEDRAEPVRLRRDGLIVDVLPTSANPSTVHVQFPGSAVRRIERAGVAIDVADPGALFCMKCRAFADRLEEDDILDAATLALGDRLLGWKVHEGILRGVSAGDVSAADVRRMSRHFDAPTARGPVLLAASYRSIVDPDEDEDERLRTLAYEAMRAVMPEEMRD